MDIETKKAQILYDCTGMDIEKHKSIAQAMQEYAEWYSERFVKCTDCGGSGIVRDGKYSEDCFKCKGSGQIIDSDYE